MARERGTSLLHSHEEASFFGPKVPNIIKTAAPYLLKVERCMLQKFIQVAMRDIEGESIPRDAFQLINVPDLPEDKITIIYAALLQILSLAFRMPTGLLRRDVFVNELTELKLSSELIEELQAVVFSERCQAMDSALVEKRLRLPRLDSFRWRVDVGKSTSVLNRVLEPTILMEMKLGDGSMETFEVPVSKFHDLRFKVTTVLKEMEDLEARNVLKIQT